MNSLRPWKSFPWHRLMLLPALSVFLVFVVLPIVLGLLLAFTNWDGFHRMEFVGLENFFAFFSDSQALGAVANTLFYGVLGTLLLNLFGLAYALILDEKIRGRGVLRTIIYLPAIISPLIIGYIWMLLLSSQNGLLVTIFEALHIRPLFKDLLADPFTARITIVVVHVWQYAGNNMIIYLAGLQSVPSELIEAGKIDGASWSQQLLRIRLPLLMPSFKINIITNIIGAMSMFDVIMSLTGGGPGHYTESLSIFIYRLSSSSRAGYTSAVSMIMFVIVLIPAALVFWVMQKHETEL